VAAVFRLLRSNLRAPLPLTVTRMFTGLVEGQGTVRILRQEPAGVRLTIAPDSDCFPVSELGMGESVCICGCCLTVVKIHDDAVDFEAGEETLSKTTLSSFEAGTRVNLERALAAGDRLGGHFVQGHVDGTATVDDIIRHDEWVDMWFRSSEELIELMVPKGSVAVDGVSLTLVKVETDRFSIALIPHTLAITTLGDRQPGQAVNIEPDILGKYVAKFVKGMQSS
jgi:riboflavin synthase